MKSVKLGRKGGCWAAFLATSLLAIASAGAQPLDFETIGGQTEPMPAPAPAGDGNLNRLTARQVVSLSAGGTLPGSVSVFTAEGLQNVRGGLPVLLIRNGRVVSATETGPKGEFNFRGVNTGVYTVMAARGDVITVLPVTIIPEGDQSNSSLDLVAVTGMPLERSLSILAGSRGVVAPQATPEPEYAPESEAALGVYRVVLNPAGGIQGYISIPGVQQGIVDFSSMRVRIIRNGRTVAEAAIKPNGRYEVDSVGAGPAGVVVFGGNGFAATGIEFIGGNFQAQNDGLEQQFVSLNNKQASDLNLGVSPPADAAAGIEEVQQFEESNIPPGATLEIPPPLAGGGLSAAGPGSGFGGGGGGGTGGLAGIAGLAAIGATLAAALSSDDDDRGFTPAPASPAIP